MGAGEGLLEGLGVSRTTSTHRPCSPPLARGTVASQVGQLAQRPPGRDISIERLVAGLTGKDSTMSVEEFFKSGSKGADTVTKH